jgi:hypothetical protein
MGQRAGHYIAWSKISRRMSLLDLLSFRPTGTIADRRAAEYVLLLLSIQAIYTVPSVNA